MWDRGWRFAVQRAALSLFAVCCLLPVCFLLYGAFTGADGGFTLRQFETVLLYTYRFYPWFWNTVIYVAGIFLINIPLSVLAAYGFSQYRVPGARALFALYILLMVLPFQATAVPQYLTLSAASLLDTRWAVILPNAFGAFGVFMLTQYMRGIDKEVMEAARLDGAGVWRSLLYIVLPLSRNSVASLAVLQFVSCWQLIDQPLLFLRSEELLPLSLELSSGVFGPGVFAAGAVFALPPVCAYLFFRDALECGISLGSVK